MVNTAELNGVAALWPSAYLLLRRKLPIFEEDGVMASFDEFADAAGNQPQAD